MAIDLVTEAAFTSKAGSFLIGVTSDQFPEPWEIPLGGHADHALPGAALASALVGLARPASGGSVKVTSTIPVGAGLSSSAAFSVALLLALGRNGDPLTLATLCQRAEEAAGAHVGLLDPLTILGAHAGHALSIDFATLETRQVPIPDAAAFVVVHCGVSRELATSLYAARRAECERAANLIGKPLGRCELGDLSALSESVLRRRARHVITECGRVREVEPGSLKSWHQTSSPRSSASRWSRFCSSVPHAISVGPTIPIPTANAPTETSKRACSWLKMDCWIGVPLRPPNALGHVIPAQPPSYSANCHALHAATCRAPASGSGLFRSRCTARVSPRGRAR